MSRQRQAKAASELDYTAFRGSSAGTESVTRVNDRKLAHSAQMFHFEHQKQQMLQMERSVYVAALTVTLTHPAHTCCSLTVANYYVS